MPDSIQYFVRRTYIARQTFYNHRLQSFLELHASSLKRDKNLFLYTLWYYFGFVPLSYQLFTGLKPRPARKTVVFYHLLGAETSRGSIQQLIITVRHPTLGWPKKLQLYARFIIGDTQD